MSRFDDIKEKASDFAEGLQHKAEAAKEHTEAEVHEARAERADDKAGFDHDGPDRSDRLKP